MGSFVCKSSYLKEIKTACHNVRSMSSFALAAAISGVFTLGLREPNHLLKDDTQALTFRDLQEFSKLVVRVTMASSKVVLSDNCI